MKTSLTISAMLLSTMLFANLPKEAVKQAVSLSTNAKVALKNNPKAIPEKNHHTSSEVDVYYNKYDAFEDETMSATMNGINYGTRFKYEYNKANGLFAALSIMHAQGVVFIKIDDKKGTLSDFSQRLLRVSGVTKIGYTIKEDAFSFTPYIGFGWSQTARADQFRLDLLYAPIGIKLGYEVIDSLLTVGLNAERSKYIHFWQTANEVLFQQNLFTDMSEFGYEVSIPITMKSCADGAWSGTFEPYVQKLADNIISYGGRVSAGRDF